MHVIRRRGWEIPERLATPEHLFFNRRAFLAAGGAAALALSPRARLRRSASPTCRIRPARSIRSSATTIHDRPSDHRREDQHQLQQFLRVRLHQEDRRAAQALKLRPWTVKIDGMVEKEQEIDIDDLLRKMPLEERLYRHRCVEAWSMAMPWSGFPDAPSWWNWRSRCRRRNTCGWRPSWIRRPRRASARSGIRGPMSRA